MTYVALALAVVLLATVSIFAGLVRSLLRSQVRERDILINQLLHATGKPWQPAPADDRPPLALVPENGYDLPSWSASPEQLPVA